MMLSDHSGQCREDHPCVEQRALKLRDPLGHSRGAGSVKLNVFDGVLKGLTMGITITPVCIKVNRINRESRPAPKKTHRVR